jgi:hypothetical protein
MFDIETMWRIVAPIAALFVATGFTMVRFDEFVVARVLFWSAAVIFGAQQFVWQLVTVTPWWFRFSAGVLTGLAVFVIFPMVLRWLCRREMKAGS